MGAHKWTGIKERGKESPRYTALFTKAGNVGGLAPKPTGCFEIRWSRTLMCKRC